MKSLKKLHELQAENQELKATVKGLIEQLAKAVSLEQRMKWMGLK